MLLSLEMAPNEIGVSTLASYAKLTQTTIKSDEQQDRLHVLEIAARAGTEIASSGVKFKTYCEGLDKFGNAVRIIRNHMKSVPDCKLVMIDYIGLMSLDASQGGKDSLRTYEIGYMTRTLKSLAMELGIVILILAQTNRNNKDNPNKMPGLSDLRDSSSFAYDANMVMFIHCEPESPNAKIVVAKNRNGATGVAELGYNRSMATFFNLGGSYV